MSGGARGGSHVTRRRGGGVGGGGVAVAVGCVRCVAHDLAVRLEVPSRLDFLGSMAAGPQMPP